MMYTTLLAVIAAAGLAATPSAGAPTMMNLNPHSPVMGAQTTPSMAPALESASLINSPATAPAAPPVVPTPVSVNVIMRAQAAARVVMGDSITPVVAPTPVPTAPALATINNVHPARPAGRAVEHSSFLSPAPAPGVASTAAGAHNEHYSSEAEDRHAGLGRHAWHVLHTMAAE